jgi:hypothetical protein
MAKSPRVIATTVRIALAKMGVARSLQLMILSNTKLKNSGLLASSITR